MAFFQQPPRALQALNQKIKGFPSFLDKRGVHMVGSYAPVGFGTGWNPSENRPPGVLIVETDDEADLAEVNTYYAGFMMFSFNRYNPVARP